MINFLKRNDVYIVMAFAVILFNLFMAAGQSPTEIPQSASDVQNISSVQLTNESIARAIRNNPSLEIVFFIFGTGATVLLFSGLYFLFGFIRRFYKKETVLFPETKVGRVEWNWPDVVRMIILITFLGYVINFTEAVVFGAVNAGSYDENFLMILNTAVIDVLVLILLFFFVKKKFSQPLSSLGLKGGSVIEKMKTGIRSYLALVPVLILLLMLINWIVQLINYEVPSQPIFDLLFKEEGTVLITVSLIFVTVFGPVVEEVFFRGFLYPALKNGTGRYIALIISAAFFAALHSNLVGFLPIFVLGAFLTFLYDITGDLTASITVHMFHNLLISSLVMLMRSV